MPAKRSSVPRSVTVGGIRLDVRLEHLEGEYFGKYRHDRREIVLSDEMAEEDAIATLHHELMHAALKIGGVAEVLTEEQEEAVVRCLEHLFLPTIV